MSVLDGITVTVLDLCNAIKQQGSIYRQSGTITSDTTDVYEVLNTATLVSFSARITQAVTAGEDRTVVVRLQKKAVFPASPVQLTNDITLDATSILGVDQTATIVSSSLSPGDVVQVKVTVAGVLETQSQGLQVGFTINEVI